MRDNWFVFVDTYDSGQRADEVISALNDQGLMQKSLLNRVQVNSFTGCKL